ncbi:MAG: GntR family transcriptional regulator [Clostridia bacterium]|nr:GntR family transcriptional regulator [Clostridia bacterium]
MTDYKALNNIAYDFLRNMIYNCELEYDKIYSETKLAAQISISRTPMRDALNRLAHERYIDILPNRGFVLHAPTESDIIEAFHVRMMTEGYCAKVVSNEYPEPLAKETIAKMEEALQQQSRLLEHDEEYSLSQFWLDDLRFHKALLAHLSIPSIIQQYESVMHIFMPHHLIRDFKTHGKDEKVLLRHRSTIIEHTEIIDALKSKDKTRVYSAINAHIASSMNALRERMNAADK